MKTVLFHLTGNANVKGVAYGLAKANLLYEYDVTIASFPGTLLDKLGELPPFKEVKRRSLDPLLRPFTHTWPFMEAGRILLPKIGLSRFTNHVGAPFFVDSVVQYIDRKVSSRLRDAKGKGATAVYGYEDTTIHSFRRARELQMKCLYDLPIGYWKAARRLLEAERERWPDWASTINILHDAEGKLQRKEEELALADQIFVASSFTKSTLSDYTGTLAPIHVIPYGFPAVSAEPRQYTYDGKRQLRILFVGSLSQRKGIADLFAAADCLGNTVRLTVVGNKTGAKCEALDKALAKHTWIPSLAHKDILQLMREHDVFVFPSLFEGFGLVITEAMSQGTPVITTDRTAGPDLIDHGKDGWLIKAGSTQALQDAIENLIQNPESVAQAGLLAQAKARRRTWDTYGQETAAVVGSMV